MTQIRSYLGSHLAVAGYLILAAGMLTALVLSFGNQRELEQAGEARGQDSISGRYFTCLEIEKLKMGQREDALRSFRELPRTLRILKLKRTPEIVALSRANRDRELKRYSKDDCVEVAHDPSGLDIEVPKEAP